MSKRCEDFSRISLFPFKNLKLKPEEKKRDFFSIKCTQRRVFFVVGCSFPWSICQKPTTPPLLLPRMKMPAIAKRERGGIKKSRRKPCREEKLAQPFSRMAIKDTFSRIRPGFSRPLLPEKNGMFSNCVREIRALGKQDLNDGVFPNKMFYWPRSSFFFSWNCCVLSFFFLANVCSLLWIE